MPLLFVMGLRIDKRGDVVFNKGILLVGRMPMNAILPSGYHLIRNEKTFDVSALVAAARFASKPDFDPCWEEYDFSQIFYIISGSGVLTTEEGSYPFYPGMMIYRPAFRRSIYHWDTEDVRFGLIDFVCSSQAMETFAPRPVALQEEESATLLDVLKTAARICEPCSITDPMQGMRLKADTPKVVLGFIYASLERFLAMVYCRLEGIDLLMDEQQKVSRCLDEGELVERVKRFLAENLQKQLRIEDICGRFLVSQSALTRKFRRETGMGVMEYFTEQKIKAAKARIGKSADSFSQIARELGYSSANYFTKVFKAKTGMTPTEYSRYVSKRRAAAK